MKHVIRKWRGEVEDLISYHLFSFSSWRNKALLQSAFIVSYQCFHAQATGSDNYTKKNLA